MNMNWIVGHNSDQGWVFINVANGDKLTAIEYKLLYGFLPPLPQVSRDGRSVTVRSSGSVTVRSSRSAGFGRKNTHG